MMILRSAPPSPFGRKVKIAAHLLGLYDQIRIEVADTLDPADAIRTQNPLGKIPALILEDGTVLYDSRVIVEYLDLLKGGGHLIPHDLGRRMGVLRLQALADGLMDAALMQVYEVRFRTESERSPKWVEHQAGKVTRALSYLETNCPTAHGAPNAGEIAVACALGYLDLRFEGRWRADHPNLVAFLDGFAGNVPSFEMTRA